MGLFSPSWMKSEKKAIKATENAGGSAKLYRIIMECPFPAARENAFKELRSMSKVEHVQARIRDIAQNGQSAFDRCYAASMITDDQLARQIMLDNIVEAYGDPFTTATWRYITAAMWIQYVNGNDEVVIAAYDAAADPKHGKLRDEFLKNLAERIHNPRALLHIIGRGDTRQVVREAENRLSHTAIQGDAESMLEDAARRGDQAAARRLVQKSPQKYAESYPEALDEESINRLGREHEHVLLQVTKNDNKAAKAAKKRLLDLDLKTYADSFPDCLYDHNLRQAVQRGYLSQESLGYIADRWLDYRGLDGTSGTALMRITDKDVLAKLLWTQAAGTYQWQRNEKIKAWFHYVIDHLGDRQDALTDYVLSDKATSWGAQGYAFDRIDDYKCLIRIAETDTWQAEKAVARLADSSLPLNDMQILVEHAKRKSVQDIAQGWLYQYRVQCGGNTDEELLEMLQWCSTHYFEGIDRIRISILDSLDSQEARLKALRHEHYDEASELLLPRINDVEGLKRLCLDLKPTARSWELHLAERSARRIAELCADKPEGDDFVAKVSTRLQDDNPVGADASDALLILAAYADVSKAQAALTYGGDAYLRSLMSEVRRANGDLSRARQAASLLADMYALDASASSVIQLEGTMYKKHVDWYNTSCGSESCNVIVNYTVEL